MLKFKVFLIAFTATLFAVFWQELNLKQLHNKYPYSNGLITSADEASYLRPPQNLLEKGKWEGSTSGVVSKIMRPPGFGIYFIILKFIFGSKVWLAMKIVQITFSFISILLFYEILKLLNVKTKIITILTIIFAFLPCYTGFMYFTITESISPFFMLLSCYFWIKLSNNKKNSLIYFILSSSFLILIRPQLLVFVLLFYLYLFFKLKWNIRIVLISIFIPFFLWNLRTYFIVGKWMGFHPIYHQTNNSLYRPNHEKMTNLFRIWEHRGDVFHSTISILSQDTSKLNLRLALKNVPSKYHLEVKPIFIEYQKLEHYRKNHFKDKPIFNYFKGEIEFGNALNQKISKLIAANKFEYYLKTPFQSLKKLILSSQLNLKIFQFDYRGKLWCEFLRWICLLTLVTSYVVCFIVIFKMKKNEFLILSIGIILSFFYLSFFQRMNEERYLTPILPLALLTLGSFFTEVKSEKNN